MAASMRQSPTTVAANPFAPENLVWHYTCAPAAALIGRDGVIRAHPGRAASSAYSIIWFADRDTYEPTAARMNLSHTDCRFGVRRVLTLPWPELANRAGMPLAERKALETTGRAQGANPALWRGIVGGDLHAGSTLFQVFHEGKWHTNNLQSFSQAILNEFEISFGSFEPIAGPNTIGRRITIRRRGMDYS